MHLQLALSPGVYAQSSFCNYRMLQFTKVMKNQQFLVINTLHCCTNTLYNTMYMYMHKKVKADILSGDDWVSDKVSYKQQCLLSGLQYFCMETFSLVPA